MIAENRLAFAILALLLIATIHRNQVWFSEETLQRDIVEKSPEKPRAHLNLGSIYVKEGKLSEALTEWATTVRLSLARPWDSVTQKDNLGAVATTNAASVYIDAGQLAHAQDILLAMPFKRPMEWYNQAAVLELRRDHPAKALAVLKTGESQFKDSAILLYNEAETYRVMGRCDEARKTYESANRADRTLGITPKECK